MSLLDETAPAPPQGAEGAEGAAVRILRGLLVGVASLAVAAIIIMPTLDLGLARFFWKGISSAGPIADHATLVLAFAAAALASLDKRHISLAGGEVKREKPQRPWKGALASFADVIAVSTQSCLFWAALSFTLTGFAASDRVWIIPTKYIAAIMPACFALMVAFTVGNVLSAFAPTVGWLMAAELRAVDGVFSLH